MPSPAESECRVVLYCGQSASIPGTLLYTSGELAYVRFRTRHWAGYGGFQNYVVTAIFREHLKFCEEQPQRAQTAADRGPQVSRSSSQQQPESKPQAPLPAVAKSEQREPSKGKLDGKEVSAGVRFPTRSPTTVRSIAGLTLRDFLGNR